MLLTELRNRLRHKGRAGGVEVADAQPAGAALAQVSQRPLRLGQVLTATAMSALVLPFDGLQPIHFDVPALLAVVVLGVFGTGFAFLIQQSQIAKEGSIAASMVAYLLPVVSVLLGVIFLHETLSWRKAKVTAPEPAKELQEAVPGAIR